LGQPGPEQLLDEIAEVDADEAAKRYLITSHVAAKAVQLRLCVCGGIGSGWLVVDGGGLSKKHRPTCVSTAPITRYPTGKARKGCEMRRMSSTRRPRQGSGQVPTSTSS
jgi:hypothetical protein